MMTGRQLSFSAHPPRVALEPFSPGLPAPREVLVRHTRTHASIGTELNFFRDGATGYGPNTPADSAQLGYMAAGVVEAVGASVTTFAKGDRVVASCPHASHGLVDTGRPAAINLIPAGVTDDEAGFVALGDVALHSVRRAGLQIDESVAVFGCGMVGQLVIQCARLSGAWPIIAVDLLDHRLALARESGASHALNAAHEDVAGQIGAITQGRGIEKSFLCAGSAAVLPVLLQAAADRGTLMITGSPSGLGTIRLREDVLRKELTIRGTYESKMQAAHPYWPWTRDRNRRACLRLLAARQLSLAHLLSHVVPAARAPELYAGLIRDSGAYLGVVFDWS